jgi:hypothetical protein
MLQSCTELEAVDVILEVPVVAVSGGGIAEGEVTK